MTKLTPSARTLIEEAKGGDEPTSVARARVRAKLLTRIGAGAATGALAGSATAAGVASKTAIATTLLFKVFGVVCIAGVIAAGVLVVRRGSEPEGAATSAPTATSSPLIEARSSSTSEAPAPRSVEVPDPPSTAPSVPYPSAMRAPSPPSSSAVAAPTHGASSAAIVPAQAASSALDAEMELMRRAQTELREGHPERALAALDEHGTEFKDGALREERLAAHILALCDLGRKDEARAEAQRFLAASPRSPMAERVRNACGGATAK